MQHAKSLFDELTTAGQPLSLEDITLYIFHGLHSEFKDLVTSLVTKAKLLSYVDLHNHLLTYEFLHKSSLPDMAANSPLLPTPSCCPLLTLPNINTGLILAVTEDIHAATGTPTTIGIIANTGLIFMVFILLPLQTGNRVTGSRPDGLLVLGSGLLTSLLS